MQTEGYLHGIELFNNEEFYECHEALEKIWLKDRSKDRLFYQGLIQLAAGFYHAKKGRPGSASSVVKRALEKLVSYPDLHRGIHLDRLMRKVRGWKPGRPFPKIK